MISISDTISPDKWQPEKMAESEVSEPKHSTNNATDMMVIPADPNNIDNFNAPTVRSSSSTPTLFKG